MKTSGNILRSHGRRAMLALVSLAALTFGSCADDDVTSGTDGDKGANVSFNVSQAQDNAQAAAKGMPVTRASFTNELALQGLTPVDLPSQKIDAQGMSGACLIETTTAGIDNNALYAPTATRANIKGEGTNIFASSDHFATIGYRGTTAASVATISSAPWFHDADTKADGVLVNAVPWRWAQPYGKFFGIYPRPADYSKLTLSPSTSTSRPYVDFEVEQNVTNQKDFMTACSGTVQYATQFVAPTTNLAFRHALTAVRFKVGQNLSWNKTITKIEIVGAKSKGRYTPSTEADGTGAAWSGQTAPTTFTLGGLSVSTSEAVNNIIVGKNNDNGTFYMIPQQLSGENVQVKVYFNGAATPAITATLKGEWKAGTTKVYALSQNTSDWNYVLNVTPTLGPVPYNSPWGGNYTVQSYRQSGTEQQPVKWKIVGYQESADGGTNWSTLSDTKPAWLNDLPVKEGDGSTTAMTAEGGIASVQIPSLVDRLAPYNVVLQNATPKGSVGNPYDLSTHDYKGTSTSMNTANSYLISAPGYYKIPLVYGNAIKNGSDNPSSYQTSVPGYVLPHFKDHAGNNITSPYINVQNSSDPATQASIVWTDQSSIVDGLSVTGSGSNSYINFHVPADKIRNGNAVIAVKNAAGTIMWSWHLWFDHDDVLNTVACTNFQGHVYNFTKQTLGFAFRKWEATAYTQPRVARIKVEQTAANGGTKQFSYIDITQNPGGVKEFASTMYQFGRKDAMPDVKTVSDGSFISDGGDNMSLQNGIQHPETFYTGDISWPTNYGFFNLWSMNNNTTGYNDNPVVKTIYDPCPAGFHMPASNAFTGFTLTGQSTGNKSQFNVSGDWDYGWHFNNKITSPNATVHFPAAGYRSAMEGGQMRGVGYGSYCYSAIPANYGQGCWLQAQEWYIDFHDNYHRGDAFSARPVAE